MPKHQWWVGGWVDSCSDALHSKTIWTGLGYILSCTQLVCPGQEHLGQHLSQLLSYIVPETFHHHCCSSQRHHGHSSWGGMCPTRFLISEFLISVFCFIFCIIIAIFIISCYDHLILWVKCILLIMSWIIPQKVTDKETDNFPAFPLNCFQDC